MSEPRHRRFVNFLQEFSIPLIVGVVVAMLAANLLPHWYEHATHWQPFGELQIFGHHLTLHFLVNDVFMVLFFAATAPDVMNHEGTNWNNTAAKAEVERGLAAEAGHGGGHEEAGAAEHH